MMVHLTSSGPGAGPSRTCSHPAPCQPPSPTASLALRASLCSGMCALALPACLPPSPRSRSWVAAVSAHAPPSTLASRLSSLALCLPVCLWSVLSVSLTLPSDLSWVSTSPLAVPTPSGVPALPSPLPLSGDPSIPHSLSAVPPSLWAGLVLAQLPGLHWLVQHLPSCLFPSALLSAPSAARRLAPTSLLLLTFPSRLPLGLFAPRLQHVHRLQYLKSHPARRQVDGTEEFSEPLRQKEACLWVLWPFPWSLSLRHTLLLASFGFCRPDTAHYSCRAGPDAVCACFFCHETPLGAKSDVVPGPPRALGALPFLAHRSGMGTKVLLPQGMCGRCSDWMEEEEGRLK